LHRNVGNAVAEAGIRGHCPISAPALDGLDVAPSSDLIFRPSRRESE